VCGGIAFAPALDASLVCAGETRARGAFGEKSARCIQGDKRRRSFIGIRLPHFPHFREVSRRARPAAVFMRPGLRRR